ncbi:MAG: hypothetical protein PHE61_07590, partial [Candidatus Omnitrophica bacterium]|nr:hypothetical protein [Candidatus Omnitrophota bacterium]
MLCYSSKDSLSLEIASLAMTAHFYKSGGAVGDRALLTPYLDHCVFSASCFSTQDIRAHTGV